MKLSVAICMLVCVIWVIQKKAALCKKYSVLLKIRDSLLYVTNTCIKVTSNYFWVNQICVECKSIKVSHKTI